MSTSRMLFTSLVKTLGATIASIAVLAAITAVPLVATHLLNIDLRAESTGSDVMRFIFGCFLVLGMSVSMVAADRIAFGPYDRR